ncbi:hypothetical protein CEXT_228001 [Caerostris extrusa]|uniref:Uncharacterized protein n=1 Tax=Caerostris extrusa TaxID=172846 RepID=A0AAV4NQ40_CAEEX|nr:hypothetical protein CEXT_228001 [Caerostris extrusa]
MGSSSACQHGGQESGSMSSQQIPPVSDDGKARCSEQKSVTVPVLPQSEAMPGPSHGDQSDSPRTRKQPSTNTRTNRRKASVLAGKACRRSSNLLMRGNRVRIRACDRNVSRGASSCTGKDSSRQNPVRNPNLRQKRAKDTGRLKLQDAKKGSNPDNQKSAVDKLSSGHDSTTMSKISLSEEDASSINTETTSIASNLGMSEEDSIETSDTQRTSFGSEQKTESSGVFHQDIIPSTPAVGDPEEDRKIQNLPTRDPGQARQIQNLPTRDPGQARQIQNLPTRDPGQARQIQNLPTRDPGPARQIQNLPTRDPGQARQIPNLPTRDPGQARQIPNLPTRDPGQARQIQTFPPEIQGRLAKFQTFPPEIQGRLAKFQTFPPEIQGRLAKFQTFPPEIQGRLAKFQNLPTRDPGQARQIPNPPYINIGPGEASTSSYQPAPRGESPEEPSSTSDVHQTGKVSERIVGRVVKVPLGLSSHHLLHAQQLFQGILRRESERGNIKASPGLLRPILDTPRSQSKVEVELYAFIRGMPANLPSPVLDQIPPQYASAARFIHGTLHALVSLVSITLAQSLALSRSLDFSRSFRGILNHYTNYTFLQESHRRFWTFNTGDFYSEGNALHSLIDLSFEYFGTVQRAFRYLMRYIYDNVQPEVKEEIKRSLKKEDREDLERED